MLDISSNVLSMFVANVITNEVRWEFESKVEHEAGAGAEDIPIT